MKKFLKILVRTLIIVLLSTVALIAGLVAFSFTESFGDLGAYFSTNVVNRSLNAKIQVERVKVSLFSNIRIDGITLTLDGKKIAGIEELEIDYSVLPAFSKQIQINEIRLQKPYVLLEKDSSGVLNFARIVKPSEETQPDTTQAGPPPDWALSLGAFRIDSGLVILNLGPKPISIQDLNLSIAVNGDLRKQDISINHLSLRSDDPKFAVKNLTAAFTRDSLGIDLNALRLTTTESDIFAQGYLNPATTVFRGELRANPISLDEIRVVEKIGFTAIRQVFLEASFDGDSTGVFLSKLAIKTSAGDLRGNLGIDFVNQLGYRANLAFEGLDASAWTDNKELGSSVNGKIYLEGIGTTPETMDADLVISLRKSRVMKVQIDTLHFNTRIRDAMAAIESFEFKSNAGWIKTAGYYDMAAQSYHLESNLRSIRLENFPLDSSWTTDINIVVGIDGTGNLFELAAAADPLAFLQDNAAFTVFVESDSSTFLGRKLDRMLVRLEKKDRMIDIRNFEIKTPLFNLTMNGTGSPFDSSLDMSFTFSLTDISLLERYAGIDSTGIDRLRLNFDIDGRVFGSFKSMNLEGSLRLSDVAFDTLLLDSIFVSFNIAGWDLRREASFQYLDSLIQGSLIAHIEGLDLGDGSVVDEFDFAFDKNGKTNRFSTSVKQDATGIYVELGGVLRLTAHDRGNLKLEKLFLEVSGENIEIVDRATTWKELQEGAAATDTLRKLWTEEWSNSSVIDIDFDMTNQRYLIHSLEIDVGQGNISAAGSVDITGKQNLELHVKDMNLERVNDIIGIERFLGGLLTLDFTLQGEFKKPLMSATWDIRQGKIGEFSYENMIGNMQHINRKIQINSTLNQNKDKTLTFGGTLPIDLSFEPVEERFTTRPIKFIAHSEGIDLRFLQPFFGRALKFRQGEIKIDLKLEGNRQKPELSGEVRLDDTEIQFPKNSLNQIFSRIRADINFTPEKIIIEQLRVQSGNDKDSKLNATGEIDLATLMTDFDIRKIGQISYDFALELEKFVPINTRSETQYLHSSEISGKIFLSGTELLRPILEGNVMMRNSEVWVVEEQLKSLEELESVEETQRVFTNLVMELSVLMPERGNNFIRSRDMRLEFFGDVVVVKTSGSEDFIIGGEVNVQKGGKYAYLGLDFTVDEGKITFKSDASMNPDIRLIASKEFRYETGPALAQIIVTGNLLEPVVVIQAVDKLSGDPLTELQTVDIIKYILGGAPGKDAAEIATQFAAATAINAVLGQVANELNLETLEYSTGGADGNGSVVKIKKRVSDRVSVGFEAELSSEGSQIFSFEYEIPADSIAWVPKTLEGSYEKAAPGEEDVFNLIFFWKKEY